MRMLGLIYSCVDVYMLLYAELTDSSAEDLAKTSECIL